jgi:predicted NUDIX family NTP pyrophosphohydrolase
VAAWAKQSAGIVLYRMAGGACELLLVHPGGPFWARRDAGAWSIPKGEHGDDENAQACARREFEEETGIALPPGALAELGTVRLKSGKLVAAWAAEGNVDPELIRSNTFEVEWPPRSGRTQAFPEVDRAGWSSSRRRARSSIRRRSRSLAACARCWTASPNEIGATPGTVSYHVRTLDRPRVITES